MKKAYDEIMDNIRVDDAMRSRILQNIAEVDLSTALPRKLRFPVRWAALAACIALVLVAGLALQNRAPVVTRPNTQGTMGQVSPIASVDTLEELEQAVAFPVEEAAGLPFAVEETAYRAISGKIAEIAYTGEGETAIFRKSQGTEDNSGSYTTYPQTISLTLDEVTVELRGKDGAYSLAVWSDGIYAWSLSLTKAVEKEVWCTLIPSRADD